MNDHRFYLSVYDLAFLGTIFIALTFALLLLFAKRINRPANRFLGLALVTITLQQIVVLAFDIRQEVYVHQWSWLPTFRLVLGPLLYFYVLKTTRPKYNFRRTDLLHFSPLILVHWHPPIHLLASTSIVTYIYLSHRLIERFYKAREFNEAGDRHRHELRWLHRLLGAFGLLSFTSVPISAVNHFFYHVGPPTYYLLYLLSAGMMIWLAVEAFLRLEVLLPGRQPLISNPPLSAALRQKGIWLKKAMETSLFYQDPELSLSSLAKALNIHPHELSRIINIALKKNFNDFINEYRVREVTGKLNDPAYDRLTLIGLAFDSGFNSKTTFNRTFKQITGKSAAEYKKAMKKERPSYHLDQSSRSTAIISFHEATVGWSSKKLKQNFMFRNYLKVAARNLLHNKNYTFINVTGLVIGIAASMLVFLLIRFETSFDDFHRDPDRIFRVVAVTTTPDGVAYLRGTAFPVAQGLRSDYPQLEHVARVYKQADNQLTVISNNSADQKKFKEKNIFFADPELFEIFNYPFAAGNAKTALSEPNAVVFTQKDADKYFGDWHNAVGRSIMYNNDKICKVTGILKDIPANTDFPMQIIFSFKTSESDTSTDWVSQNSDLNTLVVLPKGILANQFDDKLRTLVKRHTPPEHANQNYVLQPLNDIHFNGKFGNYNAVTFSRQLINTLTIIGIILLVIACVNFINLATAQTVNRSKEVGVRKVLGSTKYQLFFQFLTETFLITTVAVMIAFGLAALVLPLLDNLFQAPILLNFDFPLLTFLSASTVIVTLLAGIYPAIVISGFRPITALKNKFTRHSAGGLSMRRVLVILQFTIAQSLIIGTLVIVGQMNFFKNAPLGFNKDAVVTVPIPTDSVSLLKISALKSRLLQVAGIREVSFSTYSPVDNSHWGSDFNFDNSPKPVSFNADLKWADADYFKTYNMSFAAGIPYRNADSVEGFVINELMAAKLGYRNPKDILGKKITFWDGQVKGPIVGVVQDFHSNSLAKEITPMVLGPLKPSYQLINIKLKVDNTNQTLTSIASIWNDSYPNYVYEYQFLDDKISSLYKQQEQLSLLYKIFAAIAIFISCLGLYGLVSFMAVQRVREIGIRKVLGASISSILYLFSKEFTILIGFAFILAIPIGYYFMHSWLQNFAYRINISPSLFLITLTISLVVAWLTVGYQAIKAALANPTKSLRSE